MSIRDNVKDLLLALSDILDGKEFNPVQLKLDLSTKLDDQNILTAATELETDYIKQVCSYFCLSSEVQNRLSRSVNLAFSNKIVGLITFNYCYSKKFLLQLFSLLQNPLNKIEYCSNIYDFLAVSIINKKYVSNKINSISGFIIDQVNFFDLSTSEISYLVRCRDQQVLSLFSLKLAKEILDLEELQIENVHKKIRLLPTSLLINTSEYLQSFMEAMPISTTDKEKIKKLFRLNTIPLNYDYQRQTKIKIKSLQ